MTCKDCKFLDLEAYKNAEPSCNYPEELEFDQDGNCLKKQFDGDRLL